MEAVFLLLFDVRVIISLMKYVYFCFGLLLLPFLSYAQIEITEIMYNLEGADKKREWIEVYNSGGSDINLTDWRFNDGSNHKFAIPPEKGGQGSIILEPNTYAIIASNATTFLSEHTVDVSVIDTVMSLNNTAETLQIKNSEGIIVNEVSYENTMGADGDGNSLKLINGKWISNSPTPGIGGLSVGDTGVEKKEKDEEQNSTTGDTTNRGSQWSIEPQIFAFAGSEKRETVVGSTIYFEADALGLERKPLLNANYAWSFGDGKRKEGRKVQHTYHHPGTYVVMLDVSSGQYSATDRVYVTVIEADLFISSGENYIIIKNYNTQELDMSWWRLKTDSNIFIIPENTIILGESTVYFPNEVTNMSTNKDTIVQLQYPNGNLAEISETLSLNEYEKNTTEEADELIATQNVIEDAFQVTDDNIIQLNTSEFVKTTDTLTIYEPLNIVKNKNEIQKETAPASFTEIEISPTSQVASVANTSDETPFNYWFLAVLGTALIGIAGIRFSRSVEVSHTNNEADKYTIIEEPEIDTK